MSINSVRNKRNTQLLFKVNGSLHPKISVYLFQKVKTKTEIIRSACSECFLEIKHRPTDISYLFIDRTEKS